MPRSDRPLQVDIPKPADETPAWSKVGVVALVGFSLGILWPRFAGVRVGPSVPGAASAEAAASAAPSASARAAAASAAPSASASAAASAAAVHQELVVVGPAKITKCYDKKDKKIDECDKLAFDAIAQKKLKELASCPSALGLEGKMTMAVELMFDKKQVQVSKPKKGNTLPSSTIKGVLDCAAKQFESIALEELEHKHRRYNLTIALTFYPPGKRPEAAEDAAGGDGEDEKGKKGKEAQETEASGRATVAWDTAVVRKAPADGEIVTRLSRGTRVKIVAKQGDWLKIEAHKKSGWVPKESVEQ